MDLIPETYSQKKLIMVILSYGCCSNHFNSIEVNFNYHFLHYKKRNIPNEVHAGELHIFPTTPSLLDQSMLDSSPPEVLPFQLVPGSILSKLSSLPCSGVGVAASQGGSCKGPIAGNRGEGYPCKNSPGIIERPGDHGRDERNRRR